MLDALSTEARRRTGETLPGGGTKREVRYQGFIVNGTPLDDLVAEAVGHRGDLVARLGHGPLPWQDEGIAYLLGETTSELASHRVPVLVCGECGDIGCGAVAVRVRIEGDEVEWYDIAYENGWEPPTDYADVGPFRFPRPDYERVIRATRIVPAAGAG